MQCVDVDAVDTGDEERVSTDRAYVNVLTRGDLSSLQWIESPLKYFDPTQRQDHQLCRVHYAALNFRDVMLATGKLQPDAIPGKFSTNHLSVKARSKMQTADLRT